MPIKIIQVSSALFKLILMVLYTPYKRHSNNYQLNQRRHFQKTIYQDTNWEGLISYIEHFIPNNSFDNPILTLRG